MTERGAGYTPCTAPLLSDRLPLLRALYSARPVVEHDELVGDPGKEQGGEAVEDAPGADICLSVLHLIHQLPLQMVCLPHRLQVVISQVLHCTCSCWLPLNAGNTVNHEEEEVSSYDRS